MEHFVVQPVKTGTNLVISTLMLILFVGVLAYRGFIKDLKVNVDF